MFAVLESPSIKDETNPNPIVSTYKPALIPCKCKPKYAYNLRLKTRYVYI